MRVRSILSTLLAGLALTAAAAWAEPIPAPTDALKDYHGLGVIQIDIPTSSVVKPQPGQKVLEAPFSTWFPFRQGYVRPDRMLMVMNVGGAIQSMLATGDTEMVYSPAAGYVVKRTFKNLLPGTPNPMMTAGLSMATYARVLRENTSGKLLPAEDLEALKKKLTDRLEELRKLREELGKSKDPDDLPRANAAAAEHARLRNDLQQIDIRKAHPCHVVEFQNRDLVQTLFARGLVTETNLDFLSRGKTTVWITRAEGLPLKVETTANDGRIAIYICFSELRINQGMHPGELVLGQPAGTRMVTATGDLKDRNWEVAMEAELARQIAFYDRERQPPPPVRPRKRN
jgi:hypothetical protein